MKKYIVFILAFNIYFVNICISQTDTCKKLICQNNFCSLTLSGSSNPDSVLVDNCENSITFGKNFAKQYFFLKFQTYPFDSVIAANEIKGVYDLRDDIPDLKTKFIEIEQQFGSIFFKRYINSDDFPDSVFLDCSCLFVF